MRHAALWAACLVSADRAQRRRLRPVLLRAVDLRPVLFRVPLRAVDLRLVPLRAVVFFFAVVFLRAVLLRAVVFFFAVVFLRAVLLRPPLDLAAPPPIDPPPPIGDGGVGGVPEGCGAGQIDPGCFCADQSVPVFSSSMRPPQISFALGEVLTCDVSYRVRHRAARPYSYWTDVETLLVSSGRRRTNTSFASKRPRAVRRTRSPDQCRRRVPSSEHNAVRTRAAASWPNRDP